MADAEAGTSAKEALTLSYAELAKLKPCRDARARAKAFMGNRRMNAAEAREAGAKLDDIVWVASSIARNNPDVDRRLHLWLADCAAHVLHIYERTESSPAPRNAIIASRQFARGEIDDAAWAAARDAQNTELERMLSELVGLEVTR